MNPGSIHCLALEHQADIREEAERERLGHLAAPPTIATLSPLTAWRRRGEQLGSRLGTLRVR